MQRTGRTATRRLVTVGAALGVALLPVSGFTASGAVVQGDDTRVIQAETGDSTSVEVIAQGRTVVNGVGGSTVRLRVPSDVVLDLRRGGPGQSFVGADLRGAGPAQGFVLSDNVPSEDDGRYAYAWNLRDDYAGIVRVAGFGTFDETDLQRFVIPAGDYSLYLISDGSPVALTMEFDSLSGTAAATATRTVPLDFRELHNRAAGGDSQHNMYSVGQRASFLTGPGFHAITLATKTPGGAAEGVSGFCYYIGAVSREDTAYMPGCPSGITDGADVKESRMSDPTTGGVLVQAFTAASSPAGSRAMGYWRITDKPAEQMAALGYVLHYDPAFTPES